jgi:lipid-binding SYLF domain-containing protein
MKRIFLAATLLAAPFFTAGAARADSPQILVDQSTLALETIMTGTGGPQVQSVLKKARAVVVCPNIFRAGFIFGGEGGGCVMVARAASGSWSNPAFYSLGSGSFGLQIGVQNAQVMMMVMTDNGLNALLNSQFKFGADAGLTIASLGAGVNGSMSAGLTADIITVSRTQGLYGGLTLAGSILANNSGADTAYYGANSSTDARSIVVNMQGANPGASPLRATLSKYGS